MNCYIEQIIIFDKSGSKRIVPLKPGLNIITGNSKTGKSALIEIVDYCFGSKTFNIPRGEISNFGHLYCLVLSFESKYLILGRNDFESGGSSRSFIVVESKSFSPENLSLDYFGQSAPILLKEAQQVLEQHLNLAVANIAESDSVSDSEKRKASIREMTSFLFQHQNLVANKHALFYRFEDFYKRQATIDTFPVFSGWVDDSYFGLKRELDSLEKQLRKMELDFKKKAEAVKAIENEVKGFFRNYYKLISLPFDENRNLEELIASKNELPDYSASTFISQDVLNEYNLLKKQREEASTELLTISKSIKDLEEAERYANDFQVGLKMLDIKSAPPNEQKVYHCMTCGKVADEVTKEIVELDNARESLKHELQVLSSYTVSYQKDVDELKNQQRILKNVIKNLSGRIEDIEQTQIKIKEDGRVAETIIYAKAQIDLRIDLLLKERTIKVTDETDEIRTRIREINSILKTYNLNQKIENAQKFLSENMNKIAAKLDFEDQLKPIALKFDLETFSLFHEDQKLGRVGLNEMGSGANWLACHLSLFLSFLHYFALQEKSSMPTFLFLDQPSQVYFPSSFDLEKKKDNDVKQVEKIYISIIEEIQEVMLEAGFRPQVIVTDHADGLDLGNYDFESFVRRRWTPEFDKALI